MRIFIGTLIAVSGLSVPTLAQGTNETWPICGYEKRITCVVDGDTFWFNREKYRLFGIDAPETGEKAQCSTERVRADDATRYLQRILQSGVISLQRRGVDRYKRILVSVKTKSGDAEELMIAHGKAARYTGGYRDKQQWCR
ncbi:nuclease [Brucella endophytica]|uniref:Nuclease n=2 Tax=Brucella endophytica TaxID=1963359 RepID=A0A916SQR0_9HYPH|nr:nuclease [Brucella endophytica]